MSKRWIGIVAIAAGIAGVWGGCAAERDLAQPSEAERAATLELIGQMTALRDLSYDPTDQDRLVAAVRFDAAARLLATNRAPVGWTAPARSALPDCVTATDTTATFAGCEIEGHWLDGTISRAGPTVNAEIIDVFILDAGSQGATSIDGVLALTADSIDGAVNIDADWTQDGRDVTLHAAVGFDAVALDPDGCPIGGSMTVAGTLSAPARVAEVAVQFGPECGDLQIVR